MYSKSNKFGSHSLLVVLGLHFLICRRCDWCLFVSNLAEEFVLNSCLALIWLLLEKFLGLCELWVPCLKLGHHCINVWILNIPAESAHYMQFFILLVQLALEQVIVHASNDGVLELSDIFYAQLLHDLSIWDDPRLWSHLSNSQQLQLLKLGRL